MRKGKDKRQSRRGGRDERQSKRGGRDERQSKREGSDERQKQGQERLACPRPRLKRGVFYRFIGVTLKPTRHHFSAYRRIISEHGPN